jgi:Glucose / Sorbosone dehydrogenase
MKRRCYPLGGLIAAAAVVLSTTPAGALGPRIPDPIPAVIQQGDVTVGLETAASGLVNPVGAITAPGIKDTLFVVEQRGKIWALGTDDGHHGPGTRAPELFADLGPLGLNLGCFGIQYDERGLFGLAFSPDYKKTGLLYTYQSQPRAGATAPPANACNASVPDHDNVVTEWRVENPRSEHATVDPTSGREVLRIQHPQFNHNGGELRFGPDRLLYISVGDGGAADDEGPGHAPGGNAQDKGTLLGKILRIDPRQGSGGAAYRIPPGNPFVGRSGARGEIYALGFRNPYKMSFDVKTRQLYVADVGQNDIEEIDVVTRGGNYGWPVKEGTFAFNQNGAANGFVTGDAVTGNYIDPIAQYDHCVGPVDPNLTTPCPVREGVAVVGGFVYRGDEIHELKGHYVFAEYSTNFFASAGRLLYLDDHGAVTELKIDGRSALGLGALGIGQDSDGELYLLGKSGAVPGNTGITDPTNTSGVVLKLIEVDNQDNHGGDH